ncbi:MAG TPA: hypothetical protein VGQ42_14080 [Candidatus Dormibacteraeota bacterium]|jgi:hypothetical protein|nr:hypothetical protein [Candidatus Dormibacteraeota bacterium]
MAGFAFVVPVLPGKEARAVADMMRPRMDEFEESRGRAGITLERAYEMATPMGNFVTAYIEAEQGPAALATVAASQLPIDKDFVAALKEAHGVDISQPPAGPPPETVGEFRDPEVTTRHPGMGFALPLIPGRTEAGRAFAHEAFVTRAADHAASRRALGISVDVVTLNVTPMGDMICVYLEAADPEKANAGFAASQSAHDRWFKEQLRTLFPPHIDFDQPMPPVTTIWDWVRTPVTA